MFWINLTFLEFPPPYQNLLKLFANISVLLDSDQKRTAIKVLAAELQLLRNSKEMGQTESSEKFIKCYDFCYKGQECINDLPECFIYVRFFFPRKHYSKIISGLSFSQLWWSCIVHTSIINFVILLVQDYQTVLSN